MWRHEANADVGDLRGDNVNQLGETNPLQFLRGLSKTCSALVVHEGGVGRVTVGIHVLSEKHDFFIPSLFNAFDIMKNGVDVYTSLSSLDVM